MASIKSIHFKEDSINQVVLKLSVREAIFLAKLTGKQSTVTSDEIYPRYGSEMNTEIYDVLNGLVFNRFFDGGVQEAERNLG